jgi:hypothetical protein
MGRTGTKGRFLHARRAVGVAVIAIALVGVLAVSGLAGTSHSSGAPPAAEFRLADGSTACNYADGSISCRATGAEAGIVLERDGDSHADDRFVGWDDTTPVLLPGESWWNGDVSCRALGESEVVCSAAGGVIGVAPDGSAGASTTLSEAG